MSAHRPDPDHARAFDRVADAYDRARPSYPREAVQWLVGSEPAQVLELGAGTGKLTEVLTASGHRVTATDPSEQMLRLLRAHVPGAMVALAAAENVPLAARSVDAVVAGQSFHWFDHGRALPEVARVLRPGGVLGAVWNLRDERIPWVRRLGVIIGPSEQENDPRRAIDESGLFETVESSSFRFWQPLTRESLRDLVTSRSHVATLSDTERGRVLAKVDDLYDDYGRGADGMLLPYLTHAFRARVRPQVEADPGTAYADPDDLGTDALLIDFH
ncbi:MAG TPA: class I SAM-dependent methyltransferase [Nocardioidaceae bacterium]|nr:class I SAM-dependent methyltransferase [Nocardioidaceae bacterium]